MALAVPPSALVSRFRADLDALVGEGDGRLGVAISGGPDSLALLLLAHAARPGGIAAATVDHRLRTESADEAAFVARVCAELDVPHATLADDAPITGNVQSGARALRYRLLGHWAEATGAGWLLTAHHRDDQVETLLMRLNRGAGVGGLAGVRATTVIDRAKVARPLLGWSREELAAVVAAAGLIPVQDPGNIDPRYDRARLRAQLADAGWIDRRGVARSAAALAEADAALEWMAERLLSECVTRAGDAFQLDTDGLPGELRRRLTLRILAGLAPGVAARGPELDRLLETLASGGSATLGGVKCVGGATWRFEAAPPRRS
ncbi:tRNA lysidine(34) synthetase TilS [Sphingosinicella sp. LHD-64]|uniref:tRNA lysidine(34) synthetase TilS n=1 Tax=Sphingosinicella sp. LHD-64 TaxID=3072139 RepID=UPI00280E02B9|nr:tRNA lysidine(34) synthetase TilS [Sphingosinicella sp. LHD-64]MDQ8758064.1 tRNA lysidine(34) synthetase TilS [Sphingosinicella sp. LHD-64]